tara:strand:- start:1216 stop:1515 length:300 start_codon:yes stop_codon:yes gene_type:complete
MKKQVRRFEVKFDFEWEYGVEIIKIKEDLDALEKLGATHVDIEADVSYDCAYMSFDGYVDREETDEEQKERINKAEARENHIKQRELEQLKKLKEKYKD